MAEIADTWMAIRMGMKAHGSHTHMAQTTKHFAISTARSRVMVH